MTNLYKKKYLEECLIDYYYQQTKEGQKDMRKIIKQEDDIYIIINKTIYKCNKYNEIHHVLENIETHKKHYISWSMYWNSEQLPLHIALEKMKLYNRYDETWRESLSILTSNPIGFDETQKLTNTCTF